MLITLLCVVKHLLTEEWVAVISKTHVLIDEHGGDP